MPIKKILLLIALLFPVSAQAQSIQQSGVVTPGHAAAWITNGVLGDAGAAQSPALTSIGTVGQGNTICANSGANTGAYNQLCLGVSTNSPAQLTLQNFGGATAEPLQFVINGATYTFPFVATGVVGPGTTVVGDLTCWNNTIGTLLSDCGTSFTFSNSGLKLLGSSTGVTTFTSANSTASNFTITVPAVTDTLSAIGTAQTWTAAQTFTNSDIKLLGSSTGATTFTSANSSASNFTLTFPAITDTIATLGGVQTWTAAQTFTNSDIKLLGSSTGLTTFTSGNSGASNFTLTIPAVSDTLAVLGTAQVWTALQTFNNSDIKMKGSSTGGTTFTSANAGASNFTITVPAVTDTLATIGTAQTWTAAQTFTNSDILLLGSSTGFTTFTSANSGASNFTATVPANTGTIAELNLAQTWTASQNLSSGLVVSWNSDTGISRDSAGVIDFGNGTAANTSATLQAAHATLNALTTGTNADFLCLSSGGVILIQTTACTISSLRFKPDWKPYADNALSKINAMEVGTFHTTVASRDPNSEALQAGLNAENISKIAPECAIYEDDMMTPKSYRQECVIALLVRGMQSLQHTKQMEIPN